MLVIAKHTEEKLLHTVQNHLVQKTAISCCYLHFSQSDLTKEQLFTETLRVLHDETADYPPQVYLCQDKDVFVFLKGLQSFQMAELVGAIAKALQIPIEDDWIEVIELEHSGRRLLTLCEEKIEKQKQSKQEQQEKEQKLQVVQATQEAFAELDPALISSFQQRRAQRAESVVMFADDDQLSRTLLRSSLSGEYNLAMATNGKEALTNFVASAPDVLFLDIGMPDIDGYQVLEILFRIDPDAYIVMFSGRKNRENILKALQMGAQGFIGKPFTKNALLEAIDRCPFVQEKRAAGGLTHQHVS